MRYPLIIASVMLASNSVLAEWTGDQAEGMVSNVVISKIHVGQIEGSPYFCLYATKTDGEIQACQVKEKSVWKASFDLFYNQVMFYYSTGQQVRIYYSPGEWTHSSFVAALTSNVLVGISTCESPSSCYGPPRQRP